MTFGEMKEILTSNHISDDVKVMGNSGWECGATEVGTIYYSATKNEIHLAQKLYSYEDGEEDEYEENYLMSEDEKAHDWVRLEKK